MSGERFCARCKRPNPESVNGSLPNEWEVLVDQSHEVIGVICEGCITVGEQRAIDVDMMNLADEVEEDR